MKISIKYMLVVLIIMQIVYVGLIANSRTELENIEYYVGVLMYAFLWTALYYITNSDE